MDEGWMKCGECDLWAHKSVQGMNETLPSSFGNLIKLIIFVCLFCNIF